ncbi:glycosyltransferase family 4 protein [Mucilaginibacter sp.]|uniref:glycosyltransferase family 4 protein n=1 Tax=Mucilaginibacter sp. TaxID=1882438 RepID=UPI003568230F
MRKIKVAFFAEILTEDLDGAVRTMYQLIKRIDPAKFDFLFIYGNGPSKIAGFKSLRIPSIRLPINKNYTVALPGLARTRLNDSLNKFSPDVVHIATPSLLGYFGLNYAVKNSLPVITIYHTHFISYVDYYLKYAPFLIKKAKQILAKNHSWFYNQCNMVYVPSESIKEELCHIDVQPVKMKIWKRGIDTALFSPDKRNLKLMQQITGNKNPVILFASRLVWEKNLETLFGIYDNLQASQTAVNFLIVGDGSARRACEARMKNAIFTGKADHTYLSVLYASADIFLFPSVSETYGNVVLEAMASGLPCIIADGGGSKDFIQQGFNGFKCEPYNIADYIEKIKLTLSNKVLYKQFSAEGLICSKQLNWEQLARVYFEDISHLAESLIEDCPATPA